MITPNRKEWPNQIRSVEEMKIGKEYYKVYSHLMFSIKFIFMGITNRSQGQAINTWIEEAGEFSNSEKGENYWEDYYYCADSNLESYSPDSWNKSNYIASIDPYKNS